eukprot:COSAG04_NODE_1572_length_6292_cov_6.243178_2_plen_167_part_00
MRAGGKWLELFEEVTLEEAMRDSLLYAKPGEPSLVVQLHASKKLAQEQCQELAQEKDGLSASNKDLKDKVLRLQVRTEEMTRSFSAALAHSALWPLESLRSRDGPKTRSEFKLPVLTPVAGSLVVCGQDILRDADGEIGDLNAKLQEMTDAAETHAQKVCHHRPAC